MADLEAFRREALEAGVKVPPQIKTLTGILNYLRAQEAILTMKLMHMKMEEGEIEERIEALKKIILNINKEIGERGGGS